jgi:hypothetical protein
VQPAEAADTFDARPQQQVVGIPEDHLRPEAIELPRRYALDRARSADRHECRGAHDPMGRAQLSRASSAVRILVSDLEGQH